MSRERPQPGDDYLGCYVVLGRESGSDLVGTVERSFDLGLSPHCVRLWWSGPARDNLFGAAHQVDGRADAESNRRYFAGKYPKMTFEVWDVLDPDIPVELDWARWERDCRPSDRTLSGVVCKYGARNPLFKVKD